MSQPETSAEINRVSLKLPPFWERYPELWFVNIEAQFSVSGIKEDTTKYYSVIAALNADILMHVNDIVLAPPGTDAYATIKARLIAEFSDSEQKRLRTLLSELTLGDDRPSLLLRKMRQLAGTGLTDELLKTLWLQRLPNQTQAILSISEDKLDKLAVMADKIIETSENNTTDCFAVARQQPSDPMIEMQRQIAELTQQMQRFARSRTPTRKTHFRSNSKRQDTQQQQYCWYHEKFGQQAKKCNKPCNFRTQGNLE